LGENREERGGRSVGSGWSWETRGKKGEGVKEWIRGTSEHSNGS